MARLKFVLERFPAVLVCLKSFAANQARKQKTQIFKQTLRKGEAPGLLSRCLFNMGEVCQVRGCNGEAIAKDQGGFKTLQCQARAWHKAWRLDGAWIWSTRARPDGAEASSPAAPQPPAALEAVALDLEPVAEHEDAEDAAEEPAPSKSVALELSTVQRDALIGHWLRDHNPEVYAETLAAALKEWSPEAEQQDRYTPASTARRSWVWSFAHLRKSTGGKIWHCNSCSASGEGRGTGPYKNQTTNISDHLRTHHGLTDASSHASCQRDLGEVWPAVRQRELARSLACFVVQDLRPAHLVDMPGFDRFVFDLVGSKFVVPHRSTIGDHIARLLVEHNTLLRELVERECSGGGRLITAQADLWEAPDHRHYLGIVIHYVTASFARRTLLLYCDELGVDKTAVNQATRIRAIIRSKLGLEDSDVLFAVATDNTGNSANIAEALGVHGLRCAAHTLALAPKHQLFKVSRQTAGVQSLRVHENAVPEV